MTERRVLLGLIGLVLVYVVVSGWGNGAAAYNADRERKVKELEQNVKLCESKDTKAMLSRFVSTYKKTSDSVFVNARWAFLPYQDKKALVTWLARCYSPTRQFITVKDGFSGETVAVAGGFGITVYK